MNSITLCFICREPLKLAHHGICSFCIKPLLNSQTPLCPLCGLFTITAKQLCQSCRVNPPIWDKLFAITDYTPPLSHFIHHLKYKKQLIYIPMLARLLLLRYLAAKRDELLEKPDYILSAPLSFRRLLSRGFNQSEQLASHLRHWLTIPKDNQLSLKKIKHTKPQQTLSRTARQHNLLNCFECNSNLSGKKILLIDDIITTGYTIKNIATCLKKQGAKQIIILCLCRTL